MCSARHWYQCLCLEEGTTKKVVKQTWSNEGAPIIVFGQTVQHIVIQRIAKVMCLKEGDQRKVLQRRCQCVSEQVMQLCCSKCHKEVLQRRCYNHVYQRRGQRRWAKEGIQRRSPNRCSKDVFQRAVPNKVLQRRCAQEVLQTCVTKRCSKEGANLLQRGWSTHVC